MSCNTKPICSNETPFSVLHLCGGVTQGQFGVQEEDLLKSLTCTTSVTRGEAIQRLHNQQQAEGTTDEV